MIARWHLEGRILPHERWRIVWRRRRWGPSPTLAIALLLPLLLGDPGTPHGYHVACGRTVGEGPHPAWFRCVRQQVERQYFSDFPMLHYLADISTRYAAAAEADDVAEIRHLEFAIKGMWVED